MVRGYGSRPIFFQVGWRYDRIGCFKYGGSLNILLFEKDRFPSLNIMQGQQIGLLIGGPESEVKLTRTRLNRFWNRIPYLAK